MRPLSSLARPFAASVLVVGLAASPLAADLALAQDGGIDDLRQQREDNRRDAAEVAAEIDALAAEDEELATAVADLEAHIALQEGRVVAAEESIADAERRATTARDQATALGTDMDAIRGRLRDAAVDAFVAPGLDTLEQLSSDDLLEVEIKRSYIDEVVGDEQDLIAELRTAQADQAALEREADAAAAEAEAERADLELRLEELDESKAEVERLRDQVAVRVRDWEAVGQEIDAADAAIADQIRELEEELARQAAAAEAARRQAEEEAREVADDGDDVDPVADEPVVPVDLGPFRVEFRPVAGSIGSGFGSRRHPIFGTVRNHYGVDFNGPAGEAIAAVAAGTVLTAGWMNGYGNAVVLSHGDGFTTLYAHQSEIAVSAGETVSGGQTLGFVGSTGFSTGPHLHFEIRVDGVAVDPAPYLP